MPLRKATEQWVTLFGLYGSRTCKLGDIDVETLARMLTGEVDWSWSRFDPDTFEFEHRVEGPEFVSR